MNMIVEEYGRFIVAGLAFLMLLIIFQFFLSNSRNVMRGFIAAITGARSEFESGHWHTSDPNTLTNWDEW